MAINHSAAARVFATDPRLARLSPEEREVVEAMAFQLMDIPQVGPIAALDIIAKTCQWVLQQRGKREKKQ